MDVMNSVLAQVEIAISTKREMKSSRRQPLETRLAHEWSKAVDFTILRVRIANNQGTLSEIATREVRPQSIGCDRITISYLELYKTCH